MENVDRAIAAVLSDPNKVALYTFCVTSEIDIIYDKIRSADNINSELNDGGGYTGGYYTMEIRSTLPRVKEYFDKSDWFAVPKVLKNLISDYIYLKRSETFEFVIFRSHHD